MKIENLKLRVGDYEVTVTDVDWKNPGVEKLVAMSSTVTVEISSSNLDPIAFARAFAAITFGVGAEAAPEDGTTDLEALIPALSMSFEKDVFSVRSFNALSNAGIFFYWQLAEKTEGEALKIKNFGKKSLKEIKEVFGELGLTVGMDLSSIKHRLPKPSSAA